MYQVLIHPAEYDQCQEAVDRAFEVFPIPISGKNVMVKPNVLRKSKAEENIVTNPAVLKAVINRLEAMNPASIVVGDNPGIHSYGANEAAFEEAGLMAAAGPYYRNIGHDPVEVEFNPEYRPKVSVSRAIMEADVYISLPKFKTHGLTVMTGAVKNNYGLLPGAQKAMLHRMAGNPERFHEVVVDVFRLRPADLYIMDAVMGMEGNGPASPDLRHIGRILASNNAVALDAVVARMMGLDPARLGFMKKAKQEGLGDFAESKIEIIGQFESIPDFKVPPLGGEAIMGNEVIQEMLHGKTLLRPKADPDLCISCGMCVDQCPVEALTMEDEIPVVDPEKCITCFCCQEVCPEKAITLVEPSK